MWLLSNDKQRSNRSFVNSITTREYLRVSLYGINEEARPDTLLTKRGAGMMSATRVGPLPTGCLWMQHTYSART